CKFLLCDAVATQQVSECGSTADGRAVTGNRRQPAQWASREIDRREEKIMYAAIERLQNMSHQPHVVMERQPGDSRLPFHAAELLRYQSQVSQNIAMRDRHTPRAHR